MISPLIVDEDMEPVRINEEITCDTDEFISVSLFIHTSSINRNMRRFMLFDSLQNAFKSDWHNADNPCFVNVVGNTNITYSRRATDTSSYYYTACKCRLALFRAYSKSYIINDTNLLCQLEDNYYPEDPNMYTGLK